MTLALTLTLTFIQLFLSNELLLSFRYEWDGGCEDPRIVENDEGTYFMTYTAYDGTTARLFIASSKDLFSWTKHGAVFGPQYVNMSSKAGSIVTKMEG